VDPPPRYRRGQRPKSLARWRKLGYYTLAGPPPRILLEDLNDLLDMASSQWPRGYQPRPVWPAEWWVEEEGGDGGAPIDSIAAGLL
jgi:hypothetical protein